MSITDWRECDRPRERLLAGGVAALNDAELLAVMLGSGPPGRSAVDLGHQLLSRLGGLAGLLGAERQALCTIAGIGASRWAVLQAAQELVRRSLAEELKRGDVLGSPASVRDFLVLWLRHRSQESFAALFLDSRNRLLAAEELFRGTLTQTAVYPREVVRKALQHNAAALILAHNHPSGVAEPSHADRLLTQALKSALSQVDIPVLDHLIVAGNQAISFAEHGWL